MERGIIAFMKFTKGVEMKTHIASLFAFLMCAIAFTQAEKRSDVIIADFEGKDYGAWVVMGEAFGPGPAQGPLPGQMAVTGFNGKGLVNSFYKGDGTVGTLTSPAFIISRKYLNFLIGGGNAPGITCINLLVNGMVVRTATGLNDRAGGTEQLDSRSWDVKEFEGKSAKIEIVDKATGGWGHINVDDIILSDEKAADEISKAELYNETYRPQFHFTARQNWLNDPNGLVYYKGEYHLFFQHNPKDVVWGNMTWGHAISTDLVHWKPMPDALLPDTMGTMFSGSAVVDAKNTSGFKKGSEAPLVAFYTAAGGTNEASKGQPFTQCLAYSNDRGRTWTKYANNPILPHIAGENRDPKVVWHEASRQWIMTLYLDKEDFAFFASPDLKTWKLLHKITVPGCIECPDFFPMTVQGEPETEKWVWVAGNGRYLVGSFDGQSFIPEQPLQQPDFGANYYAVQTYSDIPASDGRRIQIAWMNGGNYPQMPFNQQMSFPCTMTLRRTPEGLRIFRNPVKEISKISEKGKKWSAFTLNPNENPLAGLQGELWDIEADFEIGEAKEVGITVRGNEIRYDVATKTLSCVNRTAPLSPETKDKAQRIKIRVLADRTSLEVFGNEGRVSITNCFLPRQRDKSIAIFTRGAKAKVLSLRVTPLRSIWKTPNTTATPTE